MQLLGRVLFIKNSFCVWFLGVGVRVVGLGIVGDLVGGVGGDVLFL